MCFGLHQILGIERRDRVRDGNDQGRGRGPPFARVKRFFIETTT
jgi:hypothetical protein